MIDEIKQETVTKSIPNGLDNLDRIIEVVTKKINELQERLAPIRSLKPIRSVSQINDDQPCEIANRLAAMRNLLGCVDADLDEILNSLEI